jgi:hypothetical protein
MILSAKAFRQERFCFFLTPNGIYGTMESTAAINSHANTAQRGTE